MFYGLTWLLVDHTKVWNQGSPSTQTRDRPQAIARITSYTYCQKTHQAVRCVSVALAIDVVHENAVCSPIVGRSAIKKSEIRENKTNIQLFHLF
jgi:hypothetical protein